MNRSEFAAEFAREYGFEKEMSIDLVDSVFDILLRATLREGKVTFHNFGTFELKTRKATTKRNPQNGETIIVPERDTITFTPSRTVKKNINARTTRAKGTAL